MKLSPTGMQFIIAREGLKLTAYKCSAGVWTIGIGHTKTATAGMEITEQQAKDLFAADIAPIELAINRLVKFNLTQEQFDALVSLVFNIGITAFSTSTMLRLLNDGKPELAAYQFLRWCYVNGKKSKGLIARRELEFKLFLGKPL